MRSEVIGVMGLGLRTKELPQVIAGAHFCTAQKIGKFHLRQRGWVSGSGM